MPWKRLGLVYAADGGNSWARTHAALPVPLQLERDIFRFYLSSRDAEQRSHVAWVDVDLSDKPRVVREASQPSLAPGTPGMFDANGTSIGSIVQHDDGLRLYYMGWDVATRERWQNTIGLARASSGDAPFERISHAPIVGRSEKDPFTLSYPWVMQLARRQWWMWYGSNLTPDLSGRGMRHVVKVARSEDGVSWKRDGATILEFA